jgi:copper(I)-binding protein
MKSFFKIATFLVLLLSPSLLLADAITIDDAYVREVPPGLPTSASFLVLKNDSDAEIALIKVTGDIAKNIELHEHVHKDGMMEMRQVEKISIPAKGETKLQPSGYHIMLIGLNKKIKAGDSVELMLEFDNGTKKTINADVKKIMQGMMKMDSKMPVPPS